MADSPIVFSAIPEVDPPELNSRLPDWLEALSSRYDRPLESLEYIFCDDDFLLKLNKEYLDHDTYTDILTFDLSEDNTKDIQGEIYISLPRVKENAVLFNQTPEWELYRVMAHGLLHLMGVDDKTDEQKEDMRKEEERALNLLKELLSGAIG